MNAIFAYAGEQPCKQILLDGLAACTAGELSGLALKSEEGISLFKAVCRPSELGTLSSAMLENGNIGIAQTAQAVRIPPSGKAEIPAANEKYAAALDGCIENHDRIKATLFQGAASVTDEELLLTYFSRLSMENIPEAMKKTAAAVGNVTFAVLCADEEAIYCRAGRNPLYIGIAEHGYFLSSEAAALLPSAVRYYVISSGESAKITSERVTVFDRKLRRVKKVQQPLSADDIGTASIFPEGSPLSCPLAVKAAISEFISGSRLNTEALCLTGRNTRKITKVLITGSGAELNAAKLAAYHFKMLTDISAYAFAAGELRYSGEIMDRNTLLFALSASGKNEDLAVCLKRAENLGAKTIAITANRLSPLALAAGDVIQVPSGNSFITAYLALSFFTLHIGCKSEIISDVYFNVTLKLAEMLTGKVSAAIKAIPYAQNASGRLMHSGNIIVTGLGADKAGADEGARMIRDSLRLCAYSEPLCELSNEKAELLSSSLVLAMITNKELAQKAMYHIRRVRSLGAEVMIITTESIEAEISDSVPIIPYPDSIPLFNPLVCLSGICKICASAQEISEKEAG